MGWSKNPSTQIVTCESYNAYASNDADVCRRRQVTAEIIRVGLRPFSMKQLRPAVDRWLVEGYLESSNVYSCLPITIDWQEINKMKWHQIIGFVGIFQPCAYNENKHFKSNMYRVFQKSVTIFIACHSHNHCRERLYFGQVAPNICRF